MVSRKLQDRRNSHLFRHVLQLLAVYSRRLLVKSLVKKQKRGLTTVLSPKLSEGFLQRKKDLQKKNHGTAKHSSRD